MYGFQYYANTLTELLAGPDCEDEYIHVTNGMIYTCKNNGERKRVKISMHILSMYI